LGIEAAFKRSNDKLDKIMNETEKKYLLIFVSIARSQTEDYYRFDK
jgi:hypothetical protein